MNGVLAQAGFIAAASWTEDHVAATTRLRLVSESMTEAYDKLRSSALIGQAAQHEFINGIANVTGELVVELSYDNDAILEFCFGSVVATRQYEFTNALAKWFHLTIDRSTRRHYFSSCKVNSFTISGDASAEDPIRLSMNLTSRVATDAATVFPTLAAVGDPVFFKHLYASSVSGFWLDTSAGTNALAAADALNIKSFEITVDHALQTDGKDSWSPSSVLDPVVNGFRSVSLKVSLARYLSTAPTSSLRTWKAAATRLQGLLTFTSSPNSYVFYLPEMKISEGAEFNVGGPGAIEGDVTFQCFRNNNNTNMAAVADQLEIVAV